MSDSQYAMSIANSAGASSLKSPPYQPLPTQLSDAEASFYNEYAWCLNALPTVREVAEHLRRELRRVQEVEEPWYRAEAVTNVFLLSCALADSVDDYLVGERYEFGHVALVLPWTAPGVRLVERVLGASRTYRQWRTRRVRRWRARWDVALGEFLTAFVAAPLSDREAHANATASLAASLPEELPRDLGECRPKIPAAFRTQDLTHVDILALGQRFVTRFPQRERSLLVVGLRTAGSYFTPLLRAYLKGQGYQDVGSVTIRPKKGIAPWERAAMERYARRAALALVLDEPPDTGGTLGMGVDLLRKMGFADRQVVALLPVHPTRRNWANGNDFLPLSRIHLVQLAPEQWYKHQLLRSGTAQARLEEYFKARNYSSARVVPSMTARSFNAELARRSEEKFHSRLKRIYEVRLGTEEGGIETRYVLAKSVGWGWLGYHAFVAAQRLSEFLPPVLGLRDGILYTEWLPQNGCTGLEHDRDRTIETAAAYVAARASCLRLAGLPSPDLGPTNQHKGIELLGSTLSRAYGWKVAAVLKRPRICRELMRHPCPRPTMIDGKMRREEWIAGPSALLKTDFEHHGFGKTELNLTDPAYDLAEAVLHLRLSEPEERQLVDRYVKASGDTQVAERLFLAKVLAGRWAMTSALANLADPSLAHRAEEFDRQYLDAVAFLTVQTTRVCASLCRRPDKPRWSSPLVVLDIDGVLDKQIFGFPSTTAAGIRAVSTLQTHAIPVALNTARTLAEVKEYCHAYGFVGGVAEYGAAVWDAVGDREQVLLSPESRWQLERVRDALREVPGVFLNDDYRNSLRAYTYEHGRTVPLPTLLVRKVLETLRADRLTFHQTYVDTAVVAKDVDKGRGLLALLELAEQREVETIAIGDSEPDLPMFHIASRSFAPRHISCRTTARLLGCRIADRSYQRGFLRSVRAIVHPRGGRCDDCEAFEPSISETVRLFWHLLEAADRGSLSLLLRAMLDPMALRTFVR